MAWFRLHEGASLDVKWPLIARNANSNVGTVVAVWTAMLDYASQQKERGSLQGFDCEAIDAFYGFEDGVCQSVFDAMTAKGMIANVRITNWDKRQPKKEDETAKERKEEWKARKAERERTPENASERSGTQGNVSERSGTPENAPDKIREDKKRELKNTPPLPPRGNEGVCNKSPASIPERPKPLPEPDLEFTDLRQKWDLHVVPEAELAGFTEYLGLKKARAWPGILAIEQDILERKTQAYWKPGYEPGLASYLRQRGWTAPRQNPRAAPQAAASVKSFAELQEEREQQRWEKLRREGPKALERQEAQACNG